MSVSDLFVRINVDKELNGHLWKAVLYLLQDRVLLNSDNVKILVA